MKCPRCKAQIEQDSIFCLECGYKIEQKGMKQKKKSSKIILIIVVLFILIIACCIIGLFFLNKKEQETIEYQSVESEKMEEKEEEQEDYIDDVEENELEENQNDTKEPKKSKEENISELQEREENEKVEKQAKVEKENENITEIQQKDDYILPDSNSRYLTNSDIANLTLQELNYAKNEIYARHGRIFKSEELSTYFHSKSWYQERYDSDEFDQNYSSNLLNDFEKKNAELLSEREYALNPSGYQLDIK